jgi:hypothetical protein
LKPQLFVLEEQLPLALVQEILVVDQVVALVEPVARFVVAVEELVEEQLEEPLEEPLEEQPEAEVVEPELWAAPV